MVGAISIASLISVAHAQPALRADVWRDGIAVDQIDDVRADADRALAAGQFERARVLYLQIAARAPHDVKALREAGRAAHALADFAAAADLLGRAATETHGPDPELHYLRGEALWALGRDAEARVVHEHARAELAGPLTDRMPKLWLARIDGRLGDRAAADAIYDALTSADPKDADAALAQVEMHAGVREWAAAERVVRRFLVSSPDHQRALALLAWIQEAEGHLDSELELRQRLAAHSDQPETVRDYGRVLERSGDWAGALAAYREAARLSGDKVDASLSRALDRIDRRMSPEIAAGVAAKSDPGATSLTAFTGVALPFGRANQISIGAARETATHADRDASTSELTAAVSLRGRTSHAIVGATLGLLDGTDVKARVLPGGFGSAGADVLGGHLRLELDGELQGAWRETPRAVLEGGTTDALTTHIYGLVSSRFVIDSGVQLRRLHFASTMDGAPLASQALMWAGADVSLWTDYAHEATGETLDDDLLHATYLADSAVIGYRHYELYGEANPMFTARLTMADRASIDEVSATVRKALAGGRIAFEARAGAGRDWIRELYLARGALALWIAPTSRSRLSFSFELAKESARALEGQRRTGWMTYHVDL